MDLDDALGVLANDVTAPLDLAELALALARDEFSHLDVEAYLTELNHWARELRPRLSGSLASRTRALCRFLHHELGFAGNQKDYDNPRNSYLNEVMDRRTGLPITLAAVAIAVGVRAGLEVVGVGLPGHFIARSMEGEQTILFDPFNGGRFLTTEQCEALVEQVTGCPFTAQQECLRPVPLGQVVQRMLNNLKAVYLRKSDYTRAARVITRLCQLRPDDVIQRRDLGVTFLQAGQPGRAIDHLAVYLRANPPDEAEIKRLLNQAQAAVCPWN